MRIFTIIFLLIPFFTLSQINQTDSNGLRQGKWEKKQANGRLAYVGQFKNGKPIGEWKRFHEGGQLKARIIYDGDSARTQMFDVWRKKIAEGVFVHQKKEGIWTYFNKNVKVSEETYKLGLKNGISRKFYKTGELMEETEWKNNLQDGNHQAFYKNGKPYLQSKMRLGKRNRLYLTFSEKGLPELEASYKNGLRHGDWKFYNESGELAYTLKYNLGELLNPEVQDSITNLQLEQLEKNKGKITDPENYIQDPSEYLNKTKQRK